jgi:hypothetical protein
MQRPAELAIVCVVFSICLVAQKTPVGYSAEEITESSQTLSDGTRIHTETHTKIYQDSQGRVRKDGENVALIFDPVADVAYHVDLKNQTAHKLAFKISYEAASPAGPAVDVEKGVIRIVAIPRGKGFEYSANLDLTSGAPIPKPIGPQQGMISGGMGGSSGGSMVRSVATYGSSGQTFSTTGGVASGDNSDRVIKQQVVMQLMSMMERRPAPGPRERPASESLGTQTFGGFVATGTRQTNTIPAGTIGNDKDLQTVTETWTSPELGRAVLSKTNDPRNGEHISRLINMTKGDPDVSLFQPPAGFKVE